MKVLKQSHENKDSSFQHAIQSEKRTWGWRTQDLKITTDSAKSWEKKKRNDVNLNDTKEDDGSNDRHSLLKKQKASVGKNYKWKMKSNLCRGGNENQLSQQQWHTQAALAARTQHVTSPNQIHTKRKWRRSVKLLGYRDCKMTRKSQRPTSRLVTSPND